MQRELARSVGETTCASCDDRGFSILEYSRRSRRDQLPEERAGDRVPVGRSPVIAAGVTSGADIRDEVCGSGKVTQLRRGVFPLK